MNITPAIWSAVAASFSALSSILMWRIQRQNMLDAARPELILEGWNRSVEGDGDAWCDVITFQTIKNGGRGAALQVTVIADHKIDALPEIVMGTIRAPILAANETITVDGRILVFWKNINPNNDGARSLPMTIAILCWDNRGIRHETRYNFIAVERASNIHLADQLVPGVMFCNRITIQRSVWLLKLIARLRAIPVLGNLVKEGK